MPRVTTEIRYTEAQIRDALALRYAAPSYGLLFNVSCGVGRPQRYADALAMSLFPSRGLERIGIEIKTTRSDWLRELKNPAKADPIFRYCHRWFLAVSNADVVKEGELPGPWGLLVMTQAEIPTLQIRAAAPKLEAADVDNQFLAAMFRRIAEQGIDARELARARAEGEKSGREKERVRVEADLRHALERRADLENAVREFEQASGLSINSRSMPRELGETVKRVLNGEERRARQRLTSLRNVAQQVAALLDEALQEEPATAAPLDAPTDTSEVAP